MICTGVESSLDRTGSEINRVTDEANRKKQEIERRLASLYKAGELGALRMFFSSESFPQDGGKYSLYAFHSG